VANLPFSKLSTTHGIRPIKRDQAAFVPFLRFVPVREDDKNNEFSSHCLKVNISGSSPSL
jgi:hypothetical protein